MALIDKASLLMVPSTYEAGKLYNVLPSGNRAPDSTDQNSGYDQTRADFDFDRGSNTAATRIGSDGLIKKYRENELLQSNQFDTTWAFGGAISVSSGQIGYDGSNDAWLLESEAVGNSLLSQNVSQSGVQAKSIYAKAGTANYLAFYNSVGLYAFFDLSAGSVGNTSSNIDTQIEPVGNGWYRCSMTYDTSIAWTRLYVADANNNFGTALGSNIYIQNAQLESGLVSTDYLESTSVTGKAGVLVDLPRINFDANGENGSLLLEPSRQNKIQYSEVFNLNWLSSGRPAVETNAVISPEGVKNGSRLSYGSGNVLRYQDELTFTNGYSYSIFVKKDVGRYVTIYAAFFTTSAIVGFDLEEGTCQEGGSIEPYGNGWFRISVFRNVAGDADKSGFFYLYSNDTLGSTISTSGNKLYVYGAQIEEATYPSSYIPNHGESGGVTRAADSCSVTGASDVIGQTEGTIFYDFKTDNKHLYKRFSLNNGSSSNWIFVGMEENVGYVRAYVRTGGVQQFSYTKSVDLTNTRIKMALAYKENDFVLYVNGSLAGSDSLGTIPLCNRIDVGSQNPLDSVKSKSSANQAALFKTRLTNAELATLTTL